MGHQKIPFMLAAVIFFIVALLHLLRLLFGVTVIIGGCVVPLWVSGFGLVFALGLSAWMYRYLK